MKIFGLLFIMLLTVKSIHAQSLDTLIIENNRIKIGFINNGTIGDVVDDKGSYLGILYDGIETLYTAGFYLSGKENGNIWSCGSFETDRVSDFIPGKFINPSADLDKFYVVKNSDPDFGTSWQDWKNAVEQGAYYYDGNKDGVYTPSDINGNGVWDANEDKPDLIGDFTAWNIFNDGVPGNERKMEEMVPLGIEIKQTVFFTGSDEIEELQDVIFMKYEITNIGVVNELLDSVYLGLAYDFDLGDHEDDLSGCNISKNIGFFYNDSSDSPRYFGETPAAAFIDLLEGPTAYIPGITYIDNNENGTYETAFDKALDTAVIKHGPNIPSEKLSGAKNLGMTSFTVYLSSLPPISTPDEFEEVRNYLLGGLNQFGEVISVKDFDIGNGNTLGDSVDTISNKYFFSGDPINGTGWLNTQPWDNRMLVNSGPFELKVNEPVNIMFAIIIARGNDYLNSIEKAYEIDEIVQKQYDNNFSDFPVNVQEDNKYIPTKFELKQNYPNPFNPSTNINYSIAEDGIVKIKIVDVLGRVIAKLVEKHQSKGEYSIYFDAGNLSSGIYFYSMEINNYKDVKKMVLMR